MSTDYSQQRFLSTEYTNMDMTSDFFLRWRVLIYCALSAKLRRHDAWELSINPGQLIDTIGILLSLLVDVELLEAFPLDLPI